jgi:hypothetical protein
MSSWSATASATRLPITPYPFTATLTLFMPDSLLDEAPQPRLRAMENVNRIASA